MKVKKLLTLTGDVIAIFKLQDVNLPVNNFEASFEFEATYFPRMATSQKR